MYKKLQNRLWRNFVPDLVDMGSGFFQGEFLYYHDVGPVAPGSKTRKFEVCHRFKGTLLGHIKWFAIWKQYCFYPLNCILDKTCMREISDFCEQETLKQKQGWKDYKNKFRENSSVTRDWKLAHAQNSND